jgi:hypothetical protein
LLDASASAPAACDSCFWTLIISLLAGVGLRVGLVLRGSGGSAATALTGLEVLLGRRLGVSCA